MQLNHLNLCVDNLSEATDFFQTFFNFQLIEQKGDAIAVMSDSNHFTLVLSNPRAFGGETPTYPNEFHIGFYVETVAEVDQMFDRLAATKIHMDHGPRKIRNGYTLYFKALGGILFEVSCFNL
ncbi:VOC family protein [Paenibacillus sp. SYP-B3998]|uniref:VOC family protein n=1 Tax=Paenibacillus sp. SYP-B3998 TaxID=2678564 RepID=A0A6G3ZXU0_9BACL|nr:VOC family protein [Paenibacillus sp. SYP-B3998]NEW06391.1 VOC family protein [Paenibacillus sp. SYP-B3998]